MKVTHSLKTNWESDSSLKLLGWEKAEVQLRFCKNCFHSMLFPKFDAALLYGARGYEIRKKIYESYFPGKLYGGKEKFNFSKALSCIGQEFHRFYNTTIFAASSISAFSAFEDADEIRILDWGGGDGYISDIYSSALRAITGLPVSNSVYDFSEWGNSRINQVGLEDLKKMDKFHIVIFSHMLEHTHEPVTTIKSALPFLVTNGLVICEVPDERLNIVRALLKRKFGLHYHVGHFSKRSLCSVLNHAGLKNIHTDYQFHSSYRGNKTSCIVGVAQNGDGLLNAKLTPTIYNEAVALLIFTIKKVLSKILR